MAIRARNGRYQIDVTYKGTREFATTETMEDARLEEARLLDKLVKAHQAKGKKVSWTLKFAGEQTMKVVWKGKRSELTNARNLKCSTEFFGEDTPLEDITAARLDDYKDALKARGNTSGTINRKLAVLSKVFTHAVSRDGLDKKPRFELEDNPKGRIRIVSQEEEDHSLSLLAQHDKTDLLEVFVCLVDLGFREGELFAVEPADVNENNTITTWVNKTDKPRTIPMSKRVQAIVKARLKTNPKGKPFPYTEDWLTGRWKFLRARMGLLRDRGFVPYCLRHTCATRLIRGGMPLKHVKEWMGHNKIETTEIYVHLVPQDLLDHAHILEPKREAAQVAKVVNGYNQVMATPDELAQQEARLSLMMRLFDAPGTSSVPAVSSYRKVTPVTQNRVTGALSPIPFGTPRS